MSDGLDTIGEIKHAVLYVQGTDTIEQVVRSMIDCDVSSVLVLNKNDEITGIITERDIVRKFTLLNVQDKLKSTANALMSRPVQFVEIEKIHHDLRFLQFVQKVRHFPVCNEKPVTKDNIVGILTASDLSRRFLRRLPKQAVDIEKEEDPSKVMLLCGIPAFRMNLTRLIKNMGWEAVIGHDPINDIKKAVDASMPIVLDIDHNYGPEHSNIITAVAQSAVESILVTGNLKLAKQLRVTLRGRKLHVMIKPIDISFMEFLFSSDSSS